MKSYVLAAASLCALIAATPAFAVQTTYTFTGDCSDCSNAKATLVLDNYMAGSDITPDNFVSFTYSSSVIDPASIADPFNLSDISGQLGDAPGQYDFMISFTSGGTIDQLPDGNVLRAAVLPIEFPSFDSFTTSTSGEWSYLRDSITDDQGMTHLWSGGESGAVPEPATWAMMVGGFGMIGGAMRRRHKSKVSFG